MKKYLYFWILLVVLAVLGTVTQPENYFVFEEQSTKMIQLFGLFGVIIAIPMVYFIYKQSREEKLYKKLWNTFLASAALFFVSFLSFAIAGQGLSGHIINISKSDKIILQGEYTIPSNDDHIKIKNRKFAFIAVAVAAIRGISGKAINFHDDENTKVYSLKLDTGMATNKLKYPQDMYLPDTNSLFHNPNNIEKATLDARKNTWGIIFDELILSK